MVPDLGIWFTETGVVSKSKLVKKGFVWLRVARYSSSFLGSQGTLSAVHRPLSPLWAQCLQEGLRVNKDVRLTTTFREEKRMKAAIGTRCTARETFEASLQLPCGAWPSQP